MQSAKLLEPPSPKLLPTRPQFIRGRYALHLIIAQDRTASSLIHANRSHRFGSVFGLWLACIDVTKPFAKADHSIFRQLPHHQIWWRRYRSCYSSASAFLVSVLIERLLLYGAL